MSTRICQHMGLAVEPHGKPPRSSPAARDRAGAFVMTVVRLTA
jgi:hypothetical protein